MQKYDLALAFGCGDLIVLRSRQSLRELSQFVVVSRKECLGRMFCGIV